VEGSEAVADGRPPDLPLVRKNQFFVRRVRRSRSDSSGGSVLGGGWKARKDKGWGRCLAAKGTCVWAKKEWTQMVKVQGKTVLGQKERVCSDLKRVGARGSGCQ